MEVLKRLLNFFLRFSGQDSRVGLLDEFIPTITAFCLTKFLLNAAFSNSTAFLLGL